MKFKMPERRLYSHVLRQEAGAVLADYLCRYPRMTAVEWQDAVLAGKVRVNGVSVPPGTVLREHDCVAYYPGEEKEPEADLRYRIVYADRELAVLEKPADLCVHPAGPFFRHTLWYQAGQELGELYFVSRLDRETSGLLLAARNKEAAARMDARIFHVRKEYLALVIGNFPEKLRAKGLLLHDTESVIPKKKRFWPDEGNAGEPEWADTEFFLEKKVPPDMSCVRAVLHTGRQHQIRATLRSLGFPVAGDKLYGPDERLFLKIREQSFREEDWRLLRMRHQALHAAVLEFCHPAGGRLMRFESGASWQT